MAATIDIQRTHNLDPELVRQRTENLAVQLREQLKVRYEWEGPNLNFTRKGVRGSIQIGETDVRVEVRLGLLHYPFKRKIEAELNAYLDENLV